ncbi:MAG: ComF family protein [Firmicutes bacterium]|nr:ComF family protein [Bacillota bacterium]
MRVLDSILNVVYPEGIYCIACGDSIDGDRECALCDRCLSEIEWDVSNPYGKGESGPGFDDLWPCCRYGYHPRQIMNGLKLGSRTWYAKSLGLLLAERIELGCRERGLSIPDIDFIIPVPMFKAKEKKRGYNQAALLAREAAKRLGIAYLPGVLVKVRDTVSLRGSSEIVRAQEVEGAFAVKNAPPELKGARVVLVDDVVTTGATTGECSKVLKAAGAGEVIAACFASSRGKGYASALAAGVDEDPEESL